MKKRNVYLFTLVLLGAIVLFSFRGRGERYFEIAKNIDIFATLFKEVNSLYVDDVNPNKLMRTGIDDMLNSLDPYTNFISEDEVEDYKTMHTGEYGSIGALTHKFGKRTVITMIFKGYTAFEKGVVIGDEILTVNDRDISALSDDEIQQLMSGQEGTPIKLKVKRYGVETPVNLEFKLQSFKRSNVPYFGMISNETGYLQLTEFTRDAAKEVMNAVVKLKESGAKSIILDLRGNPGGLLDESVNICNIFLPKGKKVVTMKGRVPAANNIYETHNEAIDSIIPLAVLVNRGSASASEIVAGTIQDYDRGLIIGEKSFGKGLVQSPKLLSYNSQIKITIAKYYTPTGRCIQVLDYTHRKADGSVGSVPDSLKKEFKTFHGRSVFDGGGIDPDDHVTTLEMPSIAQALNSDGYIFDFATVFASNHPSIGPAKTFELSDADFLDFVKWMKDKEYTYQSPVEIQLAILLDETKKERSFNDLKPQIDQVTSRLSELRKNDLMVYKDQITILLEKEIASRYYLEQGMVEAGFKTDLEVKEALSALQNSSFYRKTLHLN
jgi:carboxyl-terminal processing protease